MLSSRDQFRDHFGIFALIGRPPEKKKARGYGLFKWSECTDLNRGPLVPQSLADNTCQCCSVRESGSV